MDKRPRTKNPFRRRKKRGKKAMDNDKLQLSKSTTDLLKFNKKALDPEVNAIILDSLADLLKVKAIVSDSNTQ